MNAFNVWETQAQTDAEMQARANSHITCGRGIIGHLYRADPGQDHHRTLQACIAGPPDNWRRRSGRPRQSWLRTVEADLQPMNLGLAIGLAETRGNGYVFSDTLLKRERERET